MFITLLIPGWLRSSFLVNYSPFLTHYIYNLLFITLSPGHYVHPCLLISFIIISYHVSHSIFTSFISPYSLQLSFPVHFVDLIFFTCIILCSSRNHSLFIIHKCLFISFTSTCSPFPDHYVSPCWLSSSLLFTMFSIAWSLRSSVCSIGSSLAVHYVHHHLFISVVSTCYYVHHSQTITSALSCSLRSSFPVYYINHSQFITFIDACSLQYLFIMQSCNTYCSGCQ